MAYRAEFTISRIGESEPCPADRVSLLVEVRDYLWGKINVGDSRADVESEAADDLAYANIDAERHLNDKLWSLRVRLYANEDELRAEIFFGVALDDDDVSSSSAPMFMGELVKRYDCRVGPHQIGIAASEEDELAALLFDPERKMPVLMVSMDTEGNFPHGGLERLSGQLLGMAHVVEAPPRGRYRTEWGSQFETYNGSARIVWPGARPYFGKSEYYSSGRRDFISDVVDKLGENSSPESFDREFVAVNIACMRFRNEQLRSSTQVDEPSELKRLQRRARKAEREQERLERALASEQTERIHAENLLDTARRDVERLGEELERASNTNSTALAREEAQNLRHEKDELERRLADRENTNLKLNDELQRYRQKERIAQNSRNGFDSLIGDPTKNPGQLSLVGHGLNVMRDPVRMFIIERLAHGIARNYGLDDIGSALDRLSVDTRQARDYASALDFGEFSRVVSSYPKCFGNDAYVLSRLLKRIQTYRNRTIHPNFEENTATQRSEALLTDISEVLRMIGASEESQQVEDLMRAL